MYNNEIWIYISRFFLENIIENSNFFFSTVTKYFSLRKAVNSFIYKAKSISTSILTYILRFRMSPIGWVLTPFSSESGSAFPLYIQHIFQNDCDTFTYPLISFLVRTPLDFGKRYLQVHTYMNQISKIKYFEKPWRMVHKRGHLYLWGIRAKTIHFTLVIFVINMKLETWNAKHET